METKINKQLIYRILVYYAVLLATLAVLSRALPAFERFLVSDSPGLTAESLPLQGEDSAGNAPGLGEGAAGIYDINVFNFRALALLVSLVSTLLLTIPLAWGYSLSSHQTEQYDAILESIFLLPITVASVVSIVQNSIALAFSLAGIVAAVRFRSNIKTPADAVFVFAALAIGLATGVAELGVALIGSMFFCLTFIALRLLGVVKVVEATEPSPPPDTATETEKAASTAAAGKTAREEKHVQEG